MKTLCLIFLLLVCFTLSAQFPVLDGTLVESWNIDKQLVSAHHKRASVYIYVINAAEYRSLFNGRNYTREEQQALGIGKSDKPDLLYLSIKINDDRILPNQELNIPLLMYDFRNTSSTSQSSFKGYNGKYLSNINVSEINRSVQGEVNIQAMISNSSKQFWSEVAKISAKMAKSATGLLMGNPVDITSQLTGLLNEGIDKVSMIDNSSINVDYSFFIELISYANDPFYNELVTSTRLYRVHWDDQDVEETSFIDLNLDQTDVVPSDIEDKITDRSNPYILIVETRSEYAFQLGTPSFSKDYLERISSEWKDVSDPAKREMASTYTSVFKLAYEVHNKLEVFNAQVKLGEVDFSLLSRIIDGYYTFLKDIENANSRFQMNTSPSQHVTFFNNKYATAYRDLTTLLHDEFNGTSTSVYIDATYELVQLLAEYEKVDLDNFQISSLITDLEKLVFYEEIIENLKSENVSTEKFTLNASYARSREMRGVYEDKLYSLVTANIQTISLVRDFYQSIIDNYNLCRLCADSARYEIERIDGDNLQEAIAEYQGLVRNETNVFFECKDSMYIKVINPDLLIHINDPEKAWTDKRRQSFTDARLEFESNHSKYESNIFRNAEGAESNEILKWVDDLKKYKSKMIDNYNYLMSASLVSQATTCTISSLTTQRNDVGSPEE